MARLFIREYSTFAVDPNSGQAVGKEPGFDQPPVAISAGASPSNPFQPGTKLIRLHTDAICSLVFGTPGGPNAPVATTNNARWAANQTEYVFVNAGDAVSVISNV